jgi:hypothetical protein
MFGMTAGGPMIVEPSTGSVYSTDTDKLPSGSIVTTDGLSTTMVMLPYTPSSEVLIRSSFSTNALAKPPQPS